jgi:hypothetical protein
VNYSGGYTSGGAEGKSVFGAWARCGEGSYNSRKQDKEQVLVGRWSGLTG